MIPIAPVENHRQREKGVIVYPVYSRRSGGLSVGINLFPDQKCCSFDCPYCEVFPFSASADFSLMQMEEDLRSTVAAALDKNIVIKDICFSGNGEPTMSPAFPEALRLAGAVRAEMSPDAELVLITNGTGLLDTAIFSVLRDAVTSLSLDIWLKLDAGTADWYQKMSRSAIPFEQLVAKITEFATCAPVTIQTMLCEVDGEGPPLQEARAWEQLVVSLAATAANGTGGVRKVQLYGKARPAPEDPKSQPLPVSYLEERATSLRRVLNPSLPAPQVEVLP